MSKRALVCGGRDFADDALVWMALERYEECVGKIDVLIHGGADGADKLAAAWGARSDHTRVLSFPANWRKYGKRAGPLRNQRMLDEGKPDIVIAFPGGKGTADMVRRAEGAVPVWNVGTSGWPPDHLWTHGAKQ